MYLNILDFSVVSTYLFSTIFTETFSLLFCNPNNSTYDYKKKKKTTTITTTLNNLQLISSRTKHVSFARSHTLQTFDDSVMPAAVGGSQRFRRDCERLIDGRIVKQVWLFIHISNRSPKTCGFHSDSVYYSF